MGHADQRCADWVAFRSEDGPSSPSKAPSDPEERQWRLEALRDLRTVKTPSLTVQERIRAIRSNVLSNIRARRMLAAADNQGAK